LSRQDLRLDPRRVNDSNFSGEEVDDDAPNALDATQGAPRQAGFGLTTELVDGQTGPLEAVFE